MLGLIRVSLDDSIRLSFLIIFYLVRINLASSHVIIKGLLSNHLCKLLAIHVIKSDINVV